MKKSSRIGSIVFSAAPGVGMCRKSLPERRTSDHDGLVKNDTTSPRRTKRAIKHIHAGRVTFQPRAKHSLGCYLVEGEMFHPKQSPYLWLTRNGYAEVTGTSVSLTEKGKVLRATLRKTQTAS